MMMAFRPRSLINRRGDPLLLDAFAAVEAEWGLMESYFDREPRLDGNKIERLRDLALEPAEAVAR